jgi:predicted amidohydrolase YtcJ
MTSRTWRQPLAALRALAVLVVLVVAAALLACGTSGPTARPRTLAPAADLVFRNGAVYTLDAARSWADAVAVAGGRIAYVGPESGISSWIGPRTRVVDLQGKMLLPGFHDVHTHLVEGGVQQTECKLGELTTVEAVVAEVRRYAAEHPQAACGPSPHH